jgi:sterol desaturase/sphingolipid hydroxylase (fatty acid hydroxylase superfamily)
VTQVRARTAGDGVMPTVRPLRWPRLCLSSFLLAALTGLILWVAVGALLGQGRLGAVLAAGRAELAAPLLVALVVATGICERIWPAERRPVLARGHVQDALFLALHAIVVIPLMTLLSVGAATLIGEHAGWIELRSTQSWPGWLLIPLTVVAMDGANWLAHFADHRLDALWRFHALHHSQEELSVLTSFRAHRFHHVCDNQAVNLGVVLTIWDVLAGYARFPARGDSLTRTGLDGRPVPVEQDGSGRPALLLMAGQLAEPFQARG